ncbi:hypothetical protein CAMRE0001_0369 [Campylobacter rectus RM3267]|uniref:Uncharacterized protein n=2 Tax=Campylobacter rectus TaxID=203 RepID=A0A6G5QJR2_CAMRE|nr:hypothetical protein [Campylobacter rectus]EEF13800.1 hypothetical protein CAMRE0001_0369 [Campylobacter rectus RM3267]QCD45891.1 hypothetical protein CRECT_0190 [Campylobacter rectus]UEB48869.1 hypothetical protein LK437_06145 [Campylobacter rectus]
MILFASLNLSEFGNVGFENAGKFKSRQIRLNLKAEFKKQERQRLKFNPRRK